MRSKQGFTNIGQGIKRVGGDVAAGSQVSEVLHHYVEEYLCQQHTETIMKLLAKTIPKRCKMPKS